MLGRQLATWGNASVFLLTSHCSSLSLVLSCQSLIERSDGRIECEYDKSICI